MNRLFIIHFVIWSGMAVLAYTERIFGLPLASLLILPVVVRYLNHEYSLQISAVMMGLILATVYVLNYWLAILLVLLYLFFSKARRRRSYRRRLIWAIIFVIGFGILVRPQLTWWFLGYHLFVIVGMLAVMYINLFRRRRLLQLNFSLRAEDLL